MARGAVTRELAIGAAGVGALGLVGFADATIADDVDFTAVYLGVVAAIDGKNVSLHPSIGCAIAPTDGDDSGVLLRVARERP